MQEELYQWIKNLAVFYILFTAILHLVPDEKYERYVRSFMGLLLIFMTLTPIFAILGKSAELLERFDGYYQTEYEILNHQEMENLQTLYLIQRYEAELQDKISDVLKDTGINAEGVAVQIEGEDMSVTVRLFEEPAADLERRIKDALGTACEIQEGECNIEIVKYDAAAVDHFATAGVVSGSGGASGDRWE